MKNHAIKNIFLCVAIIAMLFLGGCLKSFDYEISNDAIAISDINENTFVNPDNSEDSYGYIEINHEKYIPYGVQGRMITNREVGACIAYSKTDSNERYYKVLENDDFIAQYYVDGVMEQFTFLRSVDTIGKDIVIPDFIDDLGYKIWQ